MRVAVVVGVAAFTIAVDALRSRPDAPVRNDLQIRRGLQGLALVVIDDALQVAREPTAIAWTAHVAVERINAGQDREKRFRGHDCRSLAFCSSNSRISRSRSISYSRRTSGQG